MYGTATSVSSAGPPVSVLANSGIPYYLFDTARCILTQVFLTIHLDYSPLGRVSAFIRPCVESNKLFAPALEINKAILRNHGIEFAAGHIVNSFREAEQSALKDLACFPRCRENPSTALVR